MHNSSTILFPDRLSDLINKKKIEGKTQNDIAKEIGISGSSLSKYSSGDDKPNIDIFVKIADYFGVSFEYLYGRTDCRQIENINISEKTGLSEEAIIQLALKKDSASYITILNYLITEKKLLRYLTNYLVGFIIKQLKETNDHLIPLEREVPLQHEQVMFAKLIEYLPMVKEKLEHDLINNHREFDNLIFEFLLKNADIQNCKYFNQKLVDSDLNLIPPDPEELNDFEQGADYFEFTDEVEASYENYRIEAQFESAEFLRHAAEKNKMMYDSITTFLSRVENEQKKGNKNCSDSKNP